MDVAVYRINNHTRSRITCDAASAGLKAAGYRPVTILESQYTRPVTEIAVFYGLQGNNPQMFADYVSSGRKAIYIDLGYWGRKLGGRWSGYHKLSVNARHPTEYFQKVRHPKDRLRRLRVPIMPWREHGKSIMVCGTSDKGARADGFAPGEWEARTIAELRKHTRRPIVYRPKPSWLGAEPIPDSLFANSREPLVKAVRDCHSVVCHHSNAAVEALTYGVPTFCWGGVAVPMSLQDLSKIESPLFPENREQWMADIAYTQWTVAEMATAEPWRHMAGEGLIPCSG